MFTIRTLNSISEKGLARLPSGSFKVADDADKPDAILLRSFVMHGMELPSSLLAVARAGAGVNNIPIETCSAKGIVVFNTPGANANAVKELAVASLLLASRDIAGGIEWAKKLPRQSTAELQKAIEKGKGGFVGPELLGKKLGVIGLGAIGVMVANAADALGMDVSGYDPFISVDAAWKLSRSVRKAISINELLSDSDYISIHVPLTPETKGSIGADQFESMKRGVRIVNLSRDGIIDTRELAKALDSGKVARYVTDFAEEELHGRSDVVIMPHLGASTPEAEDNCAIMAADQLRAYLEDGNIVNSVNLPSCEMTRSTNTRICVIHGNVPNMVGQITSALAAKGLNIADMINKSRGELAYTMIDVEGSCPEDCSLPLVNIPHVIRVRVLEA